MIRFLISVAVFLGAAALGLLVANLVLDDMTIDGASFLIAIVIFAVIQAILAPFFSRTAERRAPALLGGVGLLTTWVALLITDAVSSGLSIDGFATWVAASLIVWLVTMVAAFLLPLLVAKRVVENAREA